MALTLKTHKNRVHLSLKSSYLPHYTQLSQSEMCSQTHSRNSPWLLISHLYLKIFTMVSDFLRKSLLKFFNSIPDNHCQDIVRQWGRITYAVINIGYCGNFEFITFLGEYFRKGHYWKHCKYKEWVSFFLGSWGMHRSAEQTNCPRTASRFTWLFVSLDLFATLHSPWTQKKKTLKEWHPLFMGSMCAKFDEDEAVKSIFYSQSLDGRTRRASMYDTYFLKM